MDRFAAYSACDCLLARLHGPDFFCAVLFDRSHPVVLFAKSPVFHRFAWSTGQTELDNVFTVPGRDDYCSCLRWNEVHYSTERMGSGPLEPSERYLRDHVEYGWYRTRIGHPYFVMASCMDRVELWCRTIARQS